jgi:hypothetical protein
MTPRGDYQGWQRRKMKSAWVLDVTEPLSQSDLKLANTQTSCYMRARMQTVHLGSCLKLNCSVKAILIKIPTID